MTAEFARRNNDQWPKPKRTTLTVLPEAVTNDRDVFTGQDHSNLKQLKTRTMLLEHKLNMHALGAKNVTAADIYLNVLAVVTSAIRLLEEGTIEYRYASDAETSEPDLFK